MQNEFEQVKSRIEAEQGGPLESVDEVECKALYYFAKGVALKNELNRRAGVIGAVRAFLDGQKRRPRAARKAGKTDQRIRSP